MFKKGQVVKFIGFKNDEYDSRWCELINKNAEIVSIDYSSKYPITLEFYAETGNFIDSVSVLESEIEAISN